MKQVVSTIILVILLLLCPIFAAENNVSNTQKPIPMLHGRVDIILSSCSAAGVTLSSVKLPAIVEKVRLGSSALYAGIAKGDKVLSAQIADNKLCLLIERNGQRFFAKLKIVVSPDTEDKLVKTSPVANLKDIKLNLTNGTSLRDILANHDLVLIIDRSKSRETPDCPDHVSRWQWCAKQSFALAQVAVEASSRLLKKPAL